MLVTIEINQLASTLRVKEIEVSPTLQTPVQEPVGELLACDAHHLIEHRLDNASSWRESRESGGGDYCAVCEEVKCLVGELVRVQGWQGPAGWHSRLARSSTYRFFGPSLGTRRGAPEHVEEE